MVSDYNQIKKWQSGLDLNGSFRLRHLWAGKSLFTEISAVFFDIVCQ